MCGVLQSTVPGDYVEALWKGVASRLKHFDGDGSTCWSEAPAEGIFSILDYIVGTRPP